MTPTTEDELADIVRSADAPLRIAGGDTRRAYDPGDGPSLSMKNLTGITLYEPGALTVVAKAGTPVSELEATLDRENQYLAFEPMDHRALLGTRGEPTIGGVAGANVSGPRRIQAGACRDFMLGVRFVDGSGASIANGGRVMKNVTGYDLVKLMAGSRGTLGVLTEVSLKVLPKPDTAATLLLHDLPVDEAIRAMTAALGSPFDVTGAAHVPGDPSVTMVRIEGFESSVTYRAEQLRSILSDIGSVELESGGEDRWRAVRDVEMFGGTEGDVWRISVKPTDGTRVADALPDAQFVFDWGGGLVWALIPEGTDIRSPLKDIPGHATLVRASPENARKLGVLHPEPPAVAALSEGLRRQFDPRGIFRHDGPD